MIQNIVKSFSPILHSVKIDDIRQINCGKSTILLSDNHVKKKDYAKFVAENMKGNSCFLNTCNYELYIGTMFEPKYEIYTYHMSEVKIPEKYSQAICSSLSGFGVCYIADLTAIDIEIEMYEREESQLEAEPEYVATFMNLGDGGEYRNSFNKALLSEKMQNIPDSEIADDIENSMIRKKLLEIKELCVFLEDHQFCIADHSFPTEEGLRGDERFIIENLTEKDYNIVFNTMNEMMNGCVDQIIYDVNTNQQELLKAFVHIFEITFEL